MVKRRKVSRSKPKLKAKPKSKTKIGYLEGVSLKGVRGYAKSELNASTIKSVSAKPVYRSGHRMYKVTYIPKRKFKVKTIIRRKVKSFKKSSKVKFAAAKSRFKQKASEKFTSIKSRLKSRFRRK